MPAPAYSSASVHSGNPTTSTSLAPPTTAANDILIVAATNGGSTTALTLGGTYSGGAWTLIAGGSGTNQWGGVWWSRCTGQHSAQSISVGTATDSIAAGLIKVTGALQSGSPIDTNVSSANATSNGLGLAAFTTTVNNVLCCLCSMADGATLSSAQTMNGVSMTERVDASSTGGADSVAMIATLAKTTAGSTGAFAGTHASALSKRLVAFAIKPQPVERSAAISATGGPSVSGSFYTPLAGAGGLIQADNPRLYLRVDEASGLPQDFSGFDNHVGAVFGSPNYSESGVESRTAMAFDMTASQYMTVPHDASLNLGDDFTIEFCLRVVSHTSTNRGITSKGGGGYYVRLNGDDQLNLLISDTQDQAWCDDVFPADDAWHHVRVRKNGSTIDFRVDGVDQDATIVATDGHPNVSSDLAIANNNPGITDEFGNFGLDEIALYAHGLSDARSDIHYAALFGGGGATVERSASVSATGAVTVAGAVTHVFSRSAAISATGTVATASLTVRIRSVAISGTGTVAVAKLVIRVRSAAIAGTGTVTVAHQRYLLRQAAVAGTGNVIVSGTAAPVNVVTRSAAISGTGTVAVAGSFFHVLSRSVAIAGTGTIATAKLVIRVRSVAIAATGTVAVAGTFWTIFTRTAAISATGTVATSRLVIRVRSVAISATGAVATSRLVIRLRSVAISGTGAVTAAATFWTTFNRSAAINGTGLVEASGRSSTVSRAAAISAAGAVTVVGVIDGVAQRTVAINGVGAVSASAIRIMPRSVAIAGTAAVTCTGVVIHAHQRSAAVSAAGHVDTAAIFWTTLARASAVGGTGQVQVTGRKLLVRSVAVAATLTIQVAGRLIHLRSAGVQATGDFQAIGSYLSVLERAIGASATGLVQVSGVRLFVPKPITVEAGRPQGGWSAGTAGGWSADESERGWAATVEAE